MAGTFTLNVASASKKENCPRFVDARVLWMDLFDLRVWHPNASYELVAAECKEGAAISGDML